MNFSNCIFPYPILGHADDITTSVNFQDFKPILIANGRELIIKADLPQIDNEDILDLVRKGDAKYFCEVDCTKTVFRKIFSSDTPNFDIKIDSTDLDDSVRLTFSIVAVKEIQKYKNSKVNPMLKNIEFLIEPGFVLALFSSKTYSLNKARLKWKKEEQILLIRKVPNLSDEITSFDLTTEKIYVDVSSKTFENLQKLAQTSLNGAFLSATLVLPALYSALLIMKENDLFNQESQEFKWARFLREMVSSNKKLKKIVNNPSYDNKEMLLLAQTILKYPVVSSILSSVKK